MAKKKNPWIAAVLNFFIWGLGYLYNGKRIALGAGLLVGDILLNISIFLTLLNLPTEISTSQIDEVSGWLIILSFVLISITLAYDAHREAKGR